MWCYQKGSSWGLAEFEVKLRPISTSKRANSLLVGSLAWLVSLVRWTLSRVLASPRSTSTKTQFGLDWTEISAGVIPNVLPLFSIIFEWLREKSLRSCRRLVVQPKPVVSDKPIVDAVQNAMSDSILGDANNFKQSCCQCAIVTSRSVITCRLSDSPERSKPRHSKVPCLIGEKHTVVVSQYLQLSFQWCYFKSI